MHLQTLKIVTCVAYSFVNSLFPFTYTVPYRVQCRLDNCSINNCCINDFGYHSKRYHIVVPLEVVR